VSGLNKGLGKILVTLEWDPSPLGQPDHDLDLVAATYRADDPYGEAVYFVNFDSRSPDGTITLNRDSRTGQGFGADEALTVEFERLSTDYGRVVIGVAIQQGAGQLTFGEVAAPSYRIAEGYTELLAGDFTAVADCTAATVAEFTRDTSGAWLLHPVTRGFHEDPSAFAALMGRKTD
jgi:tellurium resistance protein TerD